MLTIRQPCVYILASRRHGTLYVGVTSNLIARLHQHRAGNNAVGDRPRETAEKLAPRLEDRADRAREPVLGGSGGRYGLRLAGVAQNGF